MASQYYVLSVPSYCLGSMPWMTAWPQRATALYLRTHIAMPKECRMNLEPGILEITCCVIT